MEFPGCSREKARPRRCFFRQLIAALEAIAVSRSTLTRDWLPLGRHRMWSNPSGFESDLKGLGGLATPGIGLSRACVKVAQLGQQASMAEFSHSSSRLAEFLKTQNLSAPRRWSQGSAALGRAWVASWARGNFAPFEAPRGVSSCAFLFLLASGGMLGAG